MNHCFLWLLLLCCCGKKNEGSSCGCDSYDHKRSYGCNSTMQKNQCSNQPPRPRCVMPADEKFICKADNGEAFLDENVCE